MSFAEACMFPLWYNPKIAGSLGAPIGGVELLSQNQPVKLVRPSRQRNDLSWKYYHFSKAASQRGLTHVQLHPLRVAYGFPVRDHNNNSNNSPFNNNNIYLLHILERVLTLTSLGEDTKKSQGQPAAAVPR